ncbi:MAG TPA: UDP-N-acetylmuramoyl-L-alanyl-D-glutamate--2,6-diaminopimelate ligase [Actinomycetota bacterium]|jgi:UDP-N-acetylmuramoyl-L-alanyl-D-glutamate--2,6-diaminopimelate ligase|nr:UDP-N-acetylmuramoyl-L-alanyl-D-glutamate--2,6-diaminopimelate ligase [Actinomycetota bacterium]
MDVTKTRRVSALAPAAGDLLVRIEGPDTEVSGVAFDSRRVGPGDLFFCVPGATSDGHLFAPAAAAAGAAALVVERPTEAGPTEIVVTDARRAMARIAAAFHGNPAGDLLILGVTGTNGKTTTAFLLESILRASGRSPGLIGTIETRIAGRVRPGVRTTPESVDLHGLFGEMRAAGVDAVAMEVTSHALTLHRVEGVHFAAAGFTNLTQDHLDFHASMEDYFAAKRSLFLPGRTARAAINVDDPYGRRLYDEADLPKVSFGVAPDAGVRAENVRLGPNGSDMTIVVDADGLEPAKAEVRTSLIGGFNVSNCLGATAVALAAGISLDDALRGIQELRAVPGRFEAVDAGQPFSVVVDYAHTPDSLDNVLKAARSLAAVRDGRVLVAFGAGGDRDRGKRPLMGGAAARLADVVVVTSDNPRSEEPRAIIDQILEGVVAVRPDGADAVIPDRREAIAHLIRSAAAGDVVVIAGKGHETGQEFADRTIPFDDREVAHEALVEAGWGERA